jgi:hypothetical protein
LLNAVSECHFANCTLLNAILQNVILPNAVASCTDFKTSLFLLGGTPKQRGKTNRAFVEDSEEEETDGGRKEVKKQGILKGEVSLYS